MARVIVGAVTLALIAAVLVHLADSVVRQRAAILETTADTTRNLVRVIGEQARGVRASEWRTSTSSPATRISATTYPCASRACAGVAGPGPDPRAS